MSLKYKYKKNNKTRSVEMPLESLINTSIEPSLKCSWRLNFLSVLMLFILFYLSVTLVQAAADLNPHEIKRIQQQPTTLCLSCHKNSPTEVLHVSGKNTLPQMNRYAKDATLMCVDCHGEDSMSHIVGVTPEYKVPADLPLNNDNQISCLSCHYVHGSLHSGKPMASTSFMDHLFNRDRLHKSYLLRRNNADGDLCLACHTE